MKKLIICIFSFFVLGGSCFSQNATNQVKDLFAKGFNLGQEGKWSEAFPYFKKAADLGDKWAQYETALCYERGEGVAVNFQEAFNYMYKAGTGDAPHEDAYMHLGTYYREGLGCSQNYEEAMKWFRKGAESSPLNKWNKTESMFCIGIMYLLGLGVQQDYAQSVYWLRKAAEQGHAVAACNLGNRYINGQGVEASEMDAVKWWRKAAELGDAGAQYNMGLVYLRGTGNTTIDKSMALKWFKKAAEQGRTEALIKVAELEGK